MSVAEVVDTSIGNNGLDMILTPPRFAKTQRCKLLLFDFWLKLFKTNMLALHSLRLK